MKNLPIFFVVILLGVSLAYSETIKVAVGLALPPYVLSETNDGIELDIVKEALIRKGHKIDIQYLPFARVVASMKSGDVDAAMTILESSGIDNAFYSDSHITYQNVVVSLTSKKLKINSIKDLADKDVLAFQNAKLYLGEDFKNMMDKNNKYREIAQQESQVAMLFIDRCDVNVIDINIFKYYKDKTNKANTSLPIVFHEIFPQTDYKMAFKSKKIRDDFNLGLAELKKDGTYNKIVKKYIK